MREHCYTSESKIGLPVYYLNTESDKCVTVVIFFNLSAVTVATAGVPVVSTLVPRTPAAPEASTRAPATGEALAAPVVPVALTPPTTAMLANTSLTDSGESYYYIIFFLGQVPMSHA